MKLIRRLSATILAAMLCLSTAFAAEPHNYSDVSPTDWYYNSVVSIDEKGILRYDTEALHAYSTVTMSELARMIFDACDIYVPLPSLGETWQTPYLRQLEAVLGGPVTNEAATRKDTATLLYKVLQLSDDAPDAGYTDEENNVCLNAVKAAGLMGGKYVDGKLAFCGDKLLTRAELLTIGNNVLKYTETTPTLLNCSYYSDISSVGALIPANVTLPENPMTKEAMSQVWDYIAIHDLTELTIEYSIPYQDSYEKMFRDLLREMNSKYSYEKPEYFGYYRHLSYSFSYQAVNNNSFKLKLKFTPLDDSLTEGIAMRTEAFAAANTMYQELYSSGKLSKSMSETERAKIILKELANKTEYKNDQTNVCHTAWSVFFRGYGVCDGISSAYQMLLRLDGIQCWGILGKSTLTGGTHLWTAAMLDGALSYTDSTWGVCWKDYDVYHYFGMTEEQCRETHSWE